MNLTLVKDKKHVSVDLHHLIICLLVLLLISSAKRSLPPQSEKTRQKTLAGLYNTTVSQNLQRSDHVNNNERDYSMFNDDDDDDLDITEIDQALLDGKAPVSSQKNEEKDHRVTNHKDSVKTDPVSRSRRYLCSWGCNSF